MENIKDERRYLKVINLLNFKEGQKTLIVVDAEKWTKYCE